MATANALGRPGVSLGQPGLAARRGHDSAPCWLLTLPSGAVPCPIDWARLCASEGVPFGYRVREVPVELYTGEVVSAWTLSAGVVRSPVDLPPSERYLSLIRMGAQELGLTRAWQERLAKIPTALMSSPAVKVSETFEDRQGATFI